MTEAAQKTYEKPQAASDSDDGFEEMPELGDLSDSNDELDGMPDLIKP